MSPDINVSTVASLPAVASPFVQLLLVLRHTRIRVQAPSADVAGGCIVKCRKHDTSDRVWSALSVAHTQGTFRNT